MTSITHTIQLEKTTINYELQFANRKTLQIAVHPDKRVVVKAPIDVSMNSIKKKILKKSRWIQKKISFFEKFEPRTPPRQYVGGESHLYLGRQYRLKIEGADSDSIVLKNGYFWITVREKSSERIQTLMMVWYKKQAEKVFSELFESCWKTFKKTGMSKPHLKLRKMKRRWGSLSSKGRLTLNTNLIKASKICIEYVIYHELCHIVHFNHGKGFYELMDATMPEWRRYKGMLDGSLV